MTAAYRALCTDFFVNQKLALKMDLPTERETLLGLFDRLRRQRSALSNLKRFEGELSLESDTDSTPYQWVCLRRTSIRSGVENPDAVEYAYGLHRTVLEVSPYFLSISSLDVDYIELTFGFDLESEANRNEVVCEALLADSPLAGVVDFEHESVLDCQPFLSIGLDETGRTQILIDVKSRVTSGEIRSARYQSSPITLYCKIRKYGPFDSIEELPLTLDRLTEQLERFTDERLLPRILNPIREAILSRPS